MKERGGGISVTTGKRRWRNLVFGLLFVVILSMLVHLAFVFGLRDGFHSSNPNFNGYVPIRKTSVPNDQSTHINELVQKLAPNISKKYFLGAKEKKREGAMKDVRGYVEKTHASAEEGNEATEDSNLLAETEGSHNTTTAPKVVSRRQVAIWVGVPVILILTALLALPEQMATLEAKIDELGEEIRKFTEDIGPDDEEITCERLTDQLKRIDNLVSEGEDTLNEFEELVNSEGEAFNREHGLRLSVLRPAFNRLHSEIASWREVKLKHREEFVKAVNLWTWYYPKRDDGGNAELKLIIHHETSHREKEKMEDTLTNLRNEGSIAAAHVETSWEEAPKLRPDDVVRNFYK